MIIKLIAKCNDLCFLDLFKDGELIAGHEGYVPPWLTDPLWGEDYVYIDIDNDTGRIVGWKPITEHQFVGNAIDWIN